MNYYNENDKKTAAWLRELIRAGLIADGEVDDRSIEEVTAKDVMGYVQCHWFAGIGGWSYALRLAGWPDDRPVWTGSCPCQPFSVAGKRKGESDSRHLWPVFARLIRECKPVTVFGEQVESAIKIGWLDGVFDDLESESYSCWAAVLGAFSVGGPHRGKRIFWVAEADAAGCTREGPSQSTKWWNYPFIPWSFQASRGADGCIRRVDSRPYSLGYGISERVAFNSGYGNAIVPQVAAKFIRAFVDSDSQENLHQNYISGKKAIANDN